MKKCRNHLKFFPPAQYIVALEENAMLFFICEYDGSTDFSVGAFSIYGVSSGVFQISVCAYHPVVKLGECIQLTDARSAQIFLFFIFFLGGGFEIQ